MRVMQLPLVRQCDGFLMVQSLRIDSPAFFIVSPREPDLLTWQGSYMCPWRCRELGQLERVMRLEKGVRQLARSEGVGRWVGVAGIGGAGQVWRGEQTIKM